MVDNVPHDERTDRARDLFLVGLRVMGLWFIFDGICFIPVAIAQLPLLVSGSFSGRQQVAFALSATLPVTARLVVGIVIVVFSARIASRFYPPTPEDAGEIRLGRVGAGDLFRIVSFALGVYALLQAVSPAIRLVDRLMTNIPHAWRSVIPEVVQTGVFVASGLLLVFGARPIAQLMTNLRYDPDSLPSQRISLWLFLALIALVAVILGLMRSMV